MELKGFKQDQQKIKAEIRHDKVAMETRQIAKKYKERWFRKVKFDIKPLNDFKKLGKNGKWYYEYPKNSLMFECLKESDYLIFQVAKLSWQRKKALNGEDISDYIITLDKLGIKAREQNAIYYRMGEWFRSNPRHKKLLLIFTR